MRAAVLVLTLAFLAPTALAEFGPESADGWPINVDGETLRPPVTPLLLAEPLNKAGPLTAYPYYPLLSLELQRLAADHPDIAKLSSAGKSEAGLDIWLLEIADFARIDAGEGVPLDQREVVMLDGGHHSNEYSGVYFVTEWAQFLLDEYGTNETAKWIVENRHTWIVPMVNPDGSHAFGRLNAKGVNINRNYPVDWGETEESFPLNNPGPAPESEKETRIVIDLVERIRPDYSASIHCCGNLWLFPYGVEHRVAPDEPMLTRICDEVYPTVRDVCGPIWSTIYPASGSSVDTVYEITGAAAWGFEMSGRGAVMPWGQPAIDADVREQETESWSGVMHAFLNVEKYGAHPTIVALSGDAARLEVTIENDGWGNLTAGNITLGGQTQALPKMAPGERATLTFEGTWNAGPLDARLDWQKRITAAPQGTRAPTLTLETEGAGLVARLGGGEAVTALGGEGGNTVPLGGLALVTASMLLAMVLRRR